MGAEVSVDAVMAELEDRIREGMRQRLRLRGGSPALDDPHLFNEAGRLLSRAVELAGSDLLFLPELLGDPDGWRLRLAMPYRSHRRAAPASVILFLKRRLLMPAFRWLFEYSHDNFERQRRVNEVLFAALQELALETVRLRRDVERLSAESDRRPAADGRDPARDFPLR